MQSFIDKWKPKNSDEIPQLFSIKALKEYITNYKKQKKKAALLYGPAGTCKTSSVYTIAQETNSEIVELNSSDFRNAAEINTIIGSAISQQSLFEKNKIILIDEIEGIAGNEDRGGLQALAKIIDKSKYPVIMTASEITNTKHNTIRKKCLLINFPPVSPTEITRILTNICLQENIKADETAIKTLARTSNGDLRAAIHDLYSLPEITTQNISNMFTRNKELLMEQAVSQVFTDNSQKSINHLFSAGEDNTWFLWLEENIPTHYTLKERAEAFENISRADIHKKRIRKQQYWRLLVYIKELLTTGVSTSKKESKPYAKCQQPQRPLSIWISNAKNSKKKLLMQKIAQKTHASNAKTIKESPYLLHIAKTLKNKEKIFQQLHLSEEEKETITTIF
ncbi:replication factor C large subunit [Candidatus Woesearchaeota archaeon]|nr:replication factor C large subunit [Candidatus Woesearchaeota archaeon]